MAFSDSEQYSTAEAFTLVISKWTNTSQKGSEKDRDYCKSFCEKMKAINDGKVLSTSYFSMPRTSNTTQ